MGFVHWWCSSFGGWKIRKTRATNLQYHDLQSSTLSTMLSYLFDQQALIHIKSYDVYCHSFLTMTIHLQLCILWQLFLRIENCHYWLLIHNWLTWALFCLIIVEMLTLSLLYLSHNNEMSILKFENWRKTGMTL